MRSELEQLRALKHLNDRQLEDMRREVDGLHQQKRDMKAQLESRMSDGLSN